MRRLFAWLSNLFDNLLNAALPPAANWWAD